MLKIQLRVSKFFSPDKTTVEKCAFVIPDKKTSTYNGVLGSGIDSPLTFLYQPVTKEVKVSRSSLFSSKRYNRPRRKLENVERTSLKVHFCGILGG